jgi:putative ABC transport system permease protein
VVVEVRDTFPGLPMSGHFAVVSREHLHAAAPTARLAPTAVLLRAADADAPRLHEAVSPLAARVTIQGRAERTAALRASPVLDAVRVGMTVAAIVAAAYAALAVAAALALAGLARAVEVAHLRTLGLSRREAFGLVVAEHGPTVLLAFAAGLALGLGLFLLLQPGLGLAALIGSGLAVPLAIDPGQLAILLAAIVAIVALGMTLSAALQRGAVPAAAIRRGFE